MAFVYLNLMFHIIAAVLCASTAWKAANLETDGSSPLIWSLASLSTFLAGWLIFPLSWPLLIASQVALALAVAVIRAALSFRKTRHE